jgi:hypothetical protein
MQDKLEKTFHLMHLPTAVSQLAANKTNRRTSLLCQNDKYKQLLETDLFFKTSESLNDVTEINAHFGSAKTFWIMFKTQKSVVNSCFWSGLNSVSIS